MSKRQVVRQPAQARCTESTHAWLQARAEVAAEFSVNCEDSPGSVLTSSTPMRGQRTPLVATGSSL
jgi:hypothetical protein